MASQAPVHYIDITGRGSVHCTPTTAPILFRLTLAAGAAALALAVTALALAIHAIEIDPDAPVHQVQSLDLVYPTANTAAIVVLALAALGLTILVKALASVTRQLKAQHALKRALARATLEDHLPIHVYADAHPVALTAGLLSPRIYVSQAALELLAPAELEAVLAHEAHHRTRRDPLRLAVAQTLEDALFFLPPVKRLARDHAHQTEIDADAATPTKPALAAAMLQLGTDAQRVDSLLGHPPSRALPLVYGLAVTTGLIVALLVALLAGRTAAGHATLALPGLSRQPCVVALALIPGTLATLAAVILRRR